VIARKVMGFASHWSASNAALPFIRGIADVLREIQNHKYVFDASYDIEETFKKAVLGGIGDGR
jgi:hypothetical protein